MRCGTCKNDLLAESFAWKKKAEGIRQSDCRTCKATYQRQWYLANRDKHRANVRARNKRIHQELLVEIRALKEASPCVDCQCRYPFYVMQFDHLRDDKIAGVSSMMNRGASRQQVLDEIAKCELVCANCHAVRTWQRLQTCLRSSVVRAADS